VIYEPLAPVHVSGHASQDEMALMIHLVKPEYLIPIHGELRHLRQHAVIAQEAGMPEDKIEIVENGQILEFDDGQLSLGERVPGGYIFVDGSRVGDVGPSVVREREALARDGVVLVSLVLDQGGRLMEDPEIITRGFVYKHSADELLEATNQRISEAVENSNGNIHDQVVQTVRSYLYNETKSRPMVLVTLSWI
jgi:ribonuclease J